ncbi:hypothetical protein HZS_83 [Henneguya salminicola]|nr:hypothetical protein HZS_83 [Henneguya salminicola]
MLIFLRKHGSNIKFFPVLVKIHHNEAAKKDASLTTQSRPNELSYYYKQKPTSPLLYQDSQHKKITQQN